MKRFSISWIILFIVLALSFVLPPGCSQESTNKPVYKKNPIMVKVEPVKRGELAQNLSYKGTVLPWQRAHIGPEISGRVKKIYKKPGDAVQKDELLAELDTTTLTLQLKQASAAYDVANAAFKDADVNYQRLKKLFEKNAVSRLQMEKAQLALEAADTQKRSTEAALNVTKHNLDNAYMKAPFSGIITSKNMEEGDIINPMMGMSTGVLTLMDLAKVKITIDVPSEDIEKIKIGQPCKVSVNTLPGQFFPGEIYSRNLAADELSKTFKVEIRVENPGVKIKAGIFAEASIETLKEENVLLLPISALMEQEKPYVVLFNNGTAKYQEVKIGVRSDRFFQVLEGLEEGQLVVVEGNYDLKEGNPVTKKSDE